MLTIDELEFLRESNNIENEWSDLALEDAILAWEYIKRQQTLTEGNIKQTHKLLMRTRTTLEPSLFGVYRTFDIAIGTDIRGWKKIGSQMKLWITNANDLIANGQGEKQPYLDEIIKQHHIRYEHIHPFGDGNGRTGRIFLNWQRLNIHLPIMIIKEKEKGRYYQWFA